LNPNCPKEAFKEVLGRGKNAPQWVSNYLNGDPAILFPERRQ